MHTLTKHQKEKRQKSYCFVSCLDWSIGPQNKSSSPLYFDWDEAWEFIWIGEAALDGEEAEIGHEEALLQLTWAGCDFWGVGIGLAGTADEAFLSCSFRMSRKEVGLGTLPESVDHAGEGDGLGGSRSPFQRTKSPREGPAGMEGNTSFSCCAGRELLPFSMGLEDYLSYDLWGCLRILG